jgi:AcrR family transcriptional regulator
MQPGRPLDERQTAMYNGSPVTQTLRYGSVSRGERQERMPKKVVTPGIDRADDRVRRSKEAVLETTYQLLMQAGLAGVSVDEVSRRSGVAKTTIYRHWPSRTALLLDACSRMASKFDIPDTGNLKEDLAELAFSIAALLRSKNFSSVLPSVVDAAERDDQIAALHSRIHAEHVAPLYVVIERARKRGELPRNCLAAEIVAAVVGPLFYRRWFSREPLDDRFIRAIVDRAVGWSK